MHHNNKEETPDFTEMFWQLLDNKLLIAIITTICMACGMLYASKQLPQFEASILMRFEENSRTGVIGSALLNQSFAGLNHGNEENIQSALIKSRVILNPVCQALGLDVFISPSQGFFKSLFSPNKAKIKIDKLQLPKHYVNKKLDLVYDTKDHVTLYDDNHKILIAGNVFSDLRNKDKSVYLKISKIQGQLGTHFSITKSSTAHVIQDLANRINITDLGGRQQIGIVNITLRDTNPHRAMRILNYIAKTLLLKDAQKKSLEASKTLDFLYQQLPITKKSLEKAELKLNQYRANSGKIDFKVQSRALLEQFMEVDKNLAELKMKKEDMKPYYTTAHPSYTSLMQKISAITKQRGVLESKLKDLPYSDQVALNLFRDIKIKTSLYTTLLRKIQELKVIKAGTVSNLNVLSFAKLPESPLPTRKNVIYLGSAILGFLLSIMIILIKKLIFPKIEDPRWIEQHFNIPNVAIIPFSKEQNDIRDTVSKTKQMILLAQAYPHNLSIEALRSFRTNLQINLSCSNNNVISILGISPSVGKTFISTNLAYLLATTDKRVLLIDGDLRKGTTHRYFNIPSAPGISELINGAKTIDEVLMPTMHKNLTVIPKGTIPSDPAEVLASTRFKECINYLSQQYDVVIIDTAPMFLLTDAILIGSIASTNYLVLGSNAHTNHEIEIVVQRLKNAEITINGAIFNFHNIRRQRNQYYYRYYNYHYHYGADNHAKGKRYYQKKTNKSVSQIN